MIRVGIGLVSRNGCYLIRQRPALPGSPMPGFWEFPGGKCELDESPAEATARECFEELGVAVQVEKCRRVIRHSYPHGDVELHYFDCSTMDPAAEPDEKTGFRWVAASDLRKLPFPEANEPILRALAEEADERRAP